MGQRRVTEDMVAFFDSLTTSQKKLWLAIYRNSPDMFQSRAVKDSIEVELAEKAEVSKNDRWYEEAVSYCTLLSFSLRHTK